MRSGHLRNGGLLLLERERAHKPPEPPPVRRSFGVWCGASIALRRRNMAELCQAALDLVPSGTKWERVEVLMKAGEGGSWQAQSLHPNWGDPHPLAIDSGQSIAQRDREAQQYGCRVVPYVVIRGHGPLYPAQDWSAGEQAQVRACYDAVGRVIINLEPGRQYYAGPLDEAGIGAYVDGYRVPPEGLEVCAIPRTGQVHELGGSESIYAFTSRCGSATWECYGITAPISGPTSLLVDEAIPRVTRYGWAPPGDQYRIPVVQRGEIERWAHTDWVKPGMQVWYMEGN